MDQDRFERIRLFTRRFHELHGLRMALFGAADAIIFGSYLIAGEPTETGVLVAIGIAVLVALPGERWLARYYATTFGRQVPASRDYRRLFALFFVFGLLGAWLDPLRTSAVLVGVGSLWVAIRDWPWRAHYLGPAAAVAVAFIAHVLGDGTTDPGMLLATTFLLIGMSFVPVGVLDHRLLVRLMNEARAPEAAAASRSGSEE